jgi:hypothetical protein
MFRGIPERTFRHPPMARSPPALVPYTGGKSLSMWEAVRWARDAAMSEKSLARVANPYRQGKMTCGQPPEGPSGRPRPFSPGDCQERPGGRAFHPESATGACHRGRPTHHRWDRDGPTGAPTHQRIHRMRGHRSGSVSRHGCRHSLSDTRGQAPAPPGHQQLMGPLPGAGSQGVIQARRIQTSAHQ